MADSHYIDVDELHPIDIIEELAERHSWEFDRIHDDQIAMAVEGQWRTYSITLAWSAYDNTLRLICTYETVPPIERMSTLFELLNLINDRCWSGAFTWWEEQNLMVYRYGLILTNDINADPGQVSIIIDAAVAACEQYYPAIQLALFTDRTAAESMEVVMTEAYGRA